MLIWYSDTEKSCKNYLSLRKIDSLLCQKIVLSQSSETSHLCSPPTPSSSWLYRGSDPQFCFQYSRCIRKECLSRITSTKIQITNFNWELPFGIVYIKENKNTLNSIRELERYYCVVLLCCMRSNLLEEDCVVLLCCLEYSDDVLFLSAVTIGIFSFLL